VWTYFDSLGATRWLSVPDVKDLPNVENINISLIHAPPRNWYLYIIIIHHHHHHQHHQVWACYYRLASIDIGHIFHKMFQTNNVGAARENQFSFGFRLPNVPASRRDKNTMPLGQPSSDRGIKMLEKNAMQRTSLIRGQCLPLTWMRRGLTVWSTCVKPDAKPPDQYLHSNQQISWPISKQETATYSLKVTSDSKRKLTDRTLTEI